METTIKDLLDIIHHAIIQKHPNKENLIILAELEAIDKKIESGELENYTMNDTTLFKSMVAGSFKSIFEQPK